MSQSTAIPYIVSAIKDIAKIAGIFKTNLVTFLADPANGIDKIISRMIKTEVLCLTDGSGETCINRSQLNQLYNSNSVIPSSYVPPVIISTTSTTSTSTTTTVNASSTDTGLAGLPTLSTSTATTTQTQSGISDSGSIGNF
jgi:hypothetical protein